MYCSKCRRKINKEADFCLNCGQKVDCFAVSNNEVIPIEFETVSFSSRIIWEVILFTTDLLIITSKELIYRKRNSYFIEVDEIAFPFKSISSIEIDWWLISTTIIVYITWNEVVNLNIFSI